MPEVAYGATGVLEYLLSISPIPGPTRSMSPNEPGSIYSDPHTHTRLEATFAAIAKYEDTLVRRLLGYLTSEKLVKRGVRVIGQEKASKTRLPTICFIVVKGETGPEMSGKDIVRVFTAKGTSGIPCGRFGAMGMLNSLRPQFDAFNVVRISLVHYNTMAEVDQLVKDLDEALGL